VKSWVKQFHERRESSQDDERTMRLASTLSKPKNTSQENYCDASLYFPDSISFDFLLFSKMKRLMRGKQGYTTDTKMRGIQERVIMNFVFIRGWMVGILSRDQSNKAICSFSI